MEAAAIATALGGLSDGWRVLTCDDPAEQLAITAVLQRAQEFDDVRLRRLARHIRNEIAAGLSGKGGE